MFFRALASETGLDNRAVDGVRELIYDFRASISGSGRPSQGPGPLRSASSQQDMHILNFSAWNISWKEALDKKNNVSGPEICSLRQGGNVDKWTLFWESPEYWSSHHTCHQERNTKRNATGVVAKQENKQKSKKKKKKKKKKRKEQKNTNIKKETYYFKQCATKPAFRFVLRSFITRLRMWGRR